MWCHHFFSLERWNAVKYQTVITSVPTATNMSWHTGIFSIAVHVWHSHPCSLYKQKHNYLIKAAANTYTLTMVGLHYREKLSCQNLFIWHLHKTSENKQRKISISTWGISARNRYRGYREVITPHRYYGMDVISKARPKYLPAFIWCWYMCITKPISCCF